MAEQPASVTEVGELRALYREPGEAIKRKLRRVLDDHSRAFIALSPFCCLATSGAGGVGLDVTPRGDLPGFVQVVGESTLVLPDRPGNNRVDSFQNVLENPHVGLLFFVPGFLDCLRVNGTAVITTDDELLAASVIDGKPVKAGLVITVEEVFFHCGRAIKRGRLWDADAQVDRTTLPSLGRILQAQLAPEADAVGAEALAGLEDESYLERLY